MPPLAMSFFNATSEAPPPTPEGPSSSECSEAMAADLQLYRDLSWWLEGVAELLIGVTGVVCNCIAIPILCSKKMSSIFNREEHFLGFRERVLLLRSDDQVFGVLA